MAQYLRSRENARLFGPKRTRIQKRQLIAGVRNTWPELAKNYRFFLFFFESELFTVIPRQCRQNTAPNSL